MDGSSCAYCGSTSLQDNRCLTCGATLSGITGSTLPEGYLLADRYQIRKFLAQGGFGITYEALDRQLGRDVAIKEFFPSGSVRKTGGQVEGPFTSQDKDDFLKEITRLARLSHPRVVRVFDSISTNNTIYMVMDKLSGETLEAAIQRKGKLTSNEVKVIAEDMLDALQELHEQQILHRDIKPSNIFLNPNGHAVLIDFGSAREFQTGKTVRHTRLLTPEYAAPEQFATEARFGPPGDLFSLAASLYHALMGTQIPNALDRALQEPKMEKVHVDVPDPELKLLLERSLYLDFKKRPQSAKEALGLLKKAPPSPRQAPSPASPPVDAYVPKTSGDDYKNNEIYKKLYTTPDPPAVPVQTPSTAQEKEQQRWARTRLHMVLLVLPVLACYIHLTYLLSDDVKIETRLLYVVFIYVPWLIFVLVRIFRSAQ